MSNVHFECFEHEGLGQHIRHYPRATSVSQEQALRLSIKQYKPRQEARPGDVTILATPALSCPKELYEPMWDALYEQSLRDDSTFRIRSIWAVDFCNQGVSGVLNEDLLGDEPSSFDHARDLLSIVNEFRDAMPRPIVGFGHSLGTLAMLNLSLIHPRLLSGMILVEPALLPKATDVPYDAVYTMTFRKDSWPSREAAVKAHLKSPLYAKWHPDVLERFKKYALRDLPTALYPDSPPTTGDKVTLTTTKHQDALTYARAAYPPQRDADVTDFASFAPPQSEDPERRWTHNPAIPFYRPENIMTYARLESIRPSCFYIYGGNSHWRKQSGPEGRRIKREKTGVGIGGSGGVADGHVADFVADGGSHYAPMEQPQVLGHRIGEWIGERTVQWKEVERKHKEVQQSIPRHKRSQFSEDWKYWAQTFKKPKSKI